MCGDPGKDARRDRAGGVHAMLFGQCAADQVDRRQTPARHGPHDLIDFDRRGNDERPFAPALAQAPIYGADLGKILTIGQLFLPGFWFCHRKKAPRGTACRTPASVPHC
jgi:hypothetical protein